MKRTTLFVALLLLPTVAMAAGNTLRVPEDQPTIQGAIDAARDGDTIIVAPGKYEEKLTIDGKKITLASRFLTSNDPADVERTILDGGKDGMKKGPSILYVKRKAEARLVGFTIQNSHHAVTNSGVLDTLHCRFIENGDALSFESGSGTIRHNVFENNTDDGIDMDGASAAVIEDNVISNNKDDGIEIRLHKHRGDLLEIVIRKNVFEGNKEDGLQLIDYPGMSDRTFRIERNVFANNAMAGLGCMPDGDTKEKYSGADLIEPVLVINNTFVGNEYGITGGDNMVLLNNVIAGSAKAAIKRVHGDSAAGVNLLWNNGDDVVDCDLNTADFVNAEPKLDQAYRPLAGSPCIDAGAASFRYNGETLELPHDTYTGSAPDLGANESHP
jgi:parallel beta-helix repeat protein